MTELIEQFVRGLPHRCGAILEALSRHDVPELATLTHKLKGAAGGYGFPVITDAAALAEAAVKQTPDDIPTVQARFDDLVSLCRSARDSLPPAEALMNRANLP